MKGSEASSQKVLAIGKIAFTCHIHVTDSLVIFLQVETSFVRQDIGILVEIYCWLLQQYP